MVYLGGTLSLAALETFVHLTAEDARLRLVAFEVVVPDDVPIDVFGLDALPHDWRDEPPPDSTKALGTAWARSGRTALAEVPSVIVPEETNLLLVPGHPDSARLLIGPPKPFGFDARMWK
jgi:RES domain-containing protein